MGTKLATPFEVTFTRELRRLRKRNVFWIVIAIVSIILNAAFIIFFVLPHK